MIPVSNKGGMGGNGLDSMGATRPLVRFCTNATGFMAIVSTPA